jgi:hypothetical protein
MPNINIRIALWGALAAILFYGYQIWMHDYPPAAAPASSAQSTAPGGSLGDFAAGRERAPPPRHPLLPRRPQPRPPLQRR